jgi:type II secretory pathway pseudopilin PulG
MLLLAWFCFVGWIILVLFVVWAHGFAGPVFWSSHLVLLAGLIAWAIHFRRKRYSRGEIILLCGFAILMVGGLASVAAVNAYGANQRSRSKRAMADMRTIATAWEARAEELHQYNAAGSAVTVPAIPSSSGINGGSSAFTLQYTFGPDALAPMLEPTYIKVFPRTDGWGNAWQFATDEPFPRGNSAPAQIYLIRSAGANGRFDPIVPGHVANHDCDIIYSNGTFLSW